MCGGGCGADEMLQWCVSPYHCTVAPNCGGRTPGRQTPGVPATLGLNVQMDGGRKMLQNCSKLPLNAATMPTPLLRTKMPTSSGDELNMGHFHCRNRLCMITGTTKAVDELRHVIDHRHSVVAHQRACQQPGPKFNELQLWELGCLPRLRTTCWTCTTNVDHLINVLQLENLCGKRDHGNLCLRHDRDDDEQHCLHTDSNEESARPANRDIDHRIHTPLGKLCGPTGPWESASAP